MKTHFTIGDRVHRLGDNEVGIISSLNDQQVLINYHRPDLIEQVSLTIHEIKHADDWDESESGTYQAWEGIDA